MNDTEAKFKEQFPVNYFSEKSRTNGNVTPGFSVIFGRYEFDKNPVIGFLMDINFWDKLLSAEEMEAGSNCKSFSPLTGNLINMTSNFNVTGDLVSRVEIESEEMSCTDTKKIILLAVRANDHFAATKQCNKILGNSFGPLQCIVGH